MDEARIVCDPKIVMGKPAIAGTRITVEHVLEELGGGLSITVVTPQHVRVPDRGLHQPD
jgi:uncharacterized protein (DUF433 family)